MDAALLNKSVLGTMELKTMRSFSSLTPSFPPSFPKGGLIFKSFPKKMGLECPLKKEEAGKIGWFVLKIYH